jgi:hypothetical protein
MQWRTIHGRAIDKAGGPLSNWHDWFAWHPVVINHTWVWLETIRRRGYQFGYDWSWEHKKKDEEGS